MRRTLSRGQVAEREGFEPSIRFPVYTRSRRAPSTTRPPLRDSDAANEHHRAFAMQGSSIRSDRKCQDGIGGFLNRSPLFLCTAFQPGCPRVRSGGETASLLRMLCRCGGAGSGDGDHKDLFNSFSGDLPVTLYRAQRRSISFKCLGWEIRAGRPTGQRGREGL